MSKKSRKPYLKLRKRMVLEQLEPRESPTDAFNAAGAIALGGLATAAEQEPDAELFRSFYVDGAWPLDESVEDELRSLGDAGASDDDSAGSSSVNSTTSTQDSGNNSQTLPSDSTLDPSLLADPLGNPLENPLAQPPQEEGGGSVGGIGVPQSQSSGGGASGGGGGGSSGASGSGGGGGGGSAASGNAMEPPVGGGSAGAGAMFGGDAGEPGGVSPEITSGSAEFPTLLSDFQSPTTAITPETVGQPEMLFELNVGQTDSQVKFLSRGPGYTLFVTPNEAVFSLARPQETPTNSTNPDSRFTTHDPRTTTREPRTRDVLRMEVVGAQENARVVGRNQLSSRTNWFIGNDRDDWHTNVPNYAEVEVQNIYDNIDLRYYSPDGDGRLEYDFIVHPGAGAQTIELDFHGAQNITVDEAGQLKIQTPSGEVTSKAPVIYQTQGETREHRTGRYRLENGKVQFEVDAFDRARPLVIDPVLEYSTYLGGSGDEHAKGIAVANDGSVYVTGITESADFPTIEPLDSTLNGVSDIYVTRYTPDGKLIFSTYLGGSSADEGKAIAVDAAGDAYLTGFTGSADFPATAGSFRTTLGGYGDAFVVKLNASGDAVLYGTYFGSTASNSVNEEGLDIAVDAYGKAYVSGLTDEGAFFPSTTGPLILGGGASDAFVAVLSEDGKQSPHATLLGGTETDRANAIAVDRLGNIYVSGTVTKYSANPDFPTTAGAFQEAYGGGNSEAFVTKFTPDLTSQVWSTLLGDTGDDGATGIAVNLTGEVFVGGATTSANFDTQSAFQSGLQGTKDGFVSKFNENGAALVWSTYLGGSDEDGVNDVFLGAGDEVLVTGFTASSDFDTQSPFQGSTGGGKDAFVTRFAAGGATLVHSSYLGGSAEDEGVSIGADLEDNVYVTGSTVSNFPTANPGQPQPGGLKDTFVTKVSAATVLPPSITAVSDDTGESNIDFITKDQTIVLSGTGPANKTIKIFRPALGEVGEVTADPNGDWTFDYTSTVLPEGSHAFWAVAVDGSIESRASDVKLVHVDITGPAVTLTYDITTTSFRPWIRATARDRHGITDNTNVYFDIDLNGDGDFNDPQENVVYPLYGGTVEIRLPQVPDTGLYLVQSRVSDLAGNENTAGAQITVVEQMNFTLDDAFSLESDPFVGLSREQLGNVQITHALDLDYSPGTGQSGNAALVYNSSSVNAQPVVQATFTIPNTSALPYEYGLELTWRDIVNNQDVVIRNWFVTAEAEAAPGDTLTIAAQVPAAAASATGRYPWQIQLLERDTLRNETYLLPEPAYGSTFVRVEDNSVYGAGWTLSLDNRLMEFFETSHYYDPTANLPAGMLWLYGNGGFRFFVDTAIKEYFSPPGDNGYLDYIEDINDPDYDKYFYTTPEQIVYEFDPGGWQTKWTSPDGHETLELERNGPNNALTGYTTIDGVQVVVDVQTDPGTQKVRVAKINLPNGITYDFPNQAAIDDLTKIVDPDGRTHDFGYDGNHKLTSATHGTGLSRVENHWIYDGHGILSFRQWGNDDSPSIWAESPAAGVGLDALHIGNVYSTSQDPLGYLTITSMDAYGRVLEVISANGGITTWERGPDSYVVAVTDPLGRRTDYLRDIWGYPEMEMLPDGTFRTWTYDNDWHTVDLFTNERGFTWDHDYDLQGHLDRVTNPLGEVTDYQFNVDTGLLEWVDDPLLRRTNYEYDTRRRLTKVIDELFGTTTNAYPTNNWGFIETVNNAKGHTWTYEGDELGRIKKVTPPSEAGEDPGSHENIYNSAGRLEEIRDRLTVPRKNPFDEYNRGLRKMDVHAADTVKTKIVTLYEYDAAGRIKRIRNPRGYWTEFDLDAMGWTLQATDTRGNTTAAEYDIAGQTVADRDKLGYWSEYVYNQRGWLTDTINPDGTVASLGYNEIGDVISVTDEMGFGPSTNYDELNRVQSESDAEGNTVGYQYWPDGRLKQSSGPLKDALGAPVVTYFEYVASADPDDAYKIKITDAKDTPRQRERYQHVDKTGNVWKEVDALGHVVFVNTLNKQDWIKRTEDALGRGVSYVHDKVGRIKEATDDEAGKTEYKIDELGRTFTVIDPEGHRTDRRYDPHNHIVATIDGRGMATTHHFNELDQKTVTVDPMGGVTRFVSNVNDSLMSLTDPVGNTTSWISNWRGQPLVETDPRGKKTHYSYDPTGRVVSIKDRRNRERIFGYFTNGWLASDGWYESQIEIHNRTWTWWEDGQMKTATGNGGTYTWDIDELGRRTSQTDIHGLTLDYTWDAGDRLTDIHESVHNCHRDFEYYDNNQLKKVEFSATGWSPLRFDLTYDNRNWTKDIKRYSDLAGSTVVSATDYGYYKDGQINTITHTDGQTPSPTTIDDFVYAYDAAHRVTSETSTISPTRNYSYDDTNQLLGDGTNAYEWDKNGNPTDTGWSVSAGNQLDSDGVWNYEYFDDGSLKKKTNIASGEVWEYEYDHLNHLTLAEHRPSATGAVDKRVQFSYDVLGNRFERIEDLDGDGPGAPATEKFAYEDGNAWADLDSLGNITMRRLYLDGLDSLFARADDAGNAHWYLTDKLGSVRDIIDNTGALVKHLDYDSFGNATDSNPTFKERYQWTAREWDDVALMQYSRQRFYDPQMRRWISQDPIGFSAGDANLYRYVGNGPTNATDPTGEFLTDAQSGSLDLFFGQLAAPALQVALDAGVDFSIDHENRDGQMLNDLQFMLDIAGMIPVVGEVFDGVNAGIYALRGDYASAALSAGAMIPFAGWAATAGKWGKRAYNGVSLLTRYGDEAAAGARMLARNGDELAGAARSVVRNSDEVAGAARSAGRRNVPT